LRCEQEFGRSRKLSETKQQQNVKQFIAVERKAIVKQFIAVERKAIVNAQVKFVSVQRGGGSIAPFILTSFPDEGEGQLAVLAAVSLGSETLVSIE
jgi:hypothetical protein